MRIASLLPAATEIVDVLGRADDLVAVTFECDVPAGIRERCPVVVRSALPGTADPAEIDALVRDRSARGLPLYDLDRAALREAAPDLVLTQDLCRVCALPRHTVAEALAAIGLDADVCSLDPRSLRDVLTAIGEVGERMGRRDRARELVARVHESLGRVAAAVAGRPAPRVLVLEWTDPPYRAGHWVPDLVRRAGGVPVGAAQDGPDGGRSVAADWPSLRATSPEVAVLAPCGLGLDDAIAQAGTVRANLPGVPLVAIDSGAYVVRSGPRLVDGVHALAWALHPDAVPAPPPGRVARLG